MLNNVPTQLNVMARQVTLNHINAIDCEVFRKTVTRVSGTTMGDLPTLGGAGVIDSEDEADFDYTNDLGSARIVFLGRFETQGNNWTDNNKTINYNELPIEVLIEPIANPKDSNYFVPDKHDIAIITPGAGITLTYEIIGITGSIAIPPYTRRYLVQPWQSQTYGL